LVGVFVGCGTLLLFVSESIQLVVTDWGVDKDDVFFKKRKLKIDYF
jgi:hypothetical protein